MQGFAHPSPSRAALETAHQVTREQLEQRHVAEATAVHGMVRWLLSSDSVARHPDASHAEHAC